MSAALADSLRRGWCPGALRPMQTGDGLLVRLRVTGGILEAGLARALAAAALDFGNGLLDLSARSNLQMRGVTEAALPSLLGRLAELGLLDADPAAESVRNVTASPLAGLAADAALDIRPVVRALEARLVADRRLHALPGKFGFLVDDGGTPSLGAIASDVRFEATPDGTGFRIGLAGGFSRAACAVADVPEAAAALALAYLALRGEGAGTARRMAAVVGRVGDAAVLAAAGLAVLPPGSRAWPRPAPAYGVLPLAEGAALGVGAPFGRWHALDLARLADIAGSSGNGELRLTPFRAILVPGLGADVAVALRDTLARDFIVSEADPRLSVAACPGAPACGNATTPTHEDALALAGVARATVRRGLAVHVSGCAKGCAHPGAAPVTLIGRDGRYDFVQNGTAGDEPARRGLTIDEAKAALRALAGAGEDPAT